MIFARRILDLLFHAGLAATVLTSAAFAQDPATTESPIPRRTPKSFGGPPVRINGVVRESDTGLPINGARVLLQSGRNSLNPDNVRDGQAGTMSTMSTPDGRFSFESVPEGLYSINAASDRYTQAPDLPKWLTVIKPQTVEIQLVKPAAISGRIVDSETRKPVAGIRVRAWRAKYQFGQQTLAPIFNDVATDGEGAFQIEKLVPGPYFLEMYAPEMEEQVLTGDEAAAVPSDAPPKTGYRRQWWPGDSAAFAQPFTARGGTGGNTVEISLTRKPVFRITGELKPAGCKAPDAPKLDVSQLYGHGQFGTMTSRGKSVAIPCGSKFTIANLAPGEYYLTTRALPANSGDLRAWAKVVVTDRDLKEDLILAPPIGISGALKVPKGFPDDHPRLFLNAAFVDALSPGSTGAAIAGDNTFLLSTPFPSTMQAQVSGLAAPWFVSEVRYGGVPVPDGIVTLNPLMTTQTLTLRVSAGSGAVQGAVKEKGDPVASPKVLLLPWPLRWKDSFPIFFETTATDGSFTMTQLPPDTYRVLAVEAEAWNTELQRPGVLEALAAGGTEVTISEGQTASTMLELKRVVITPW